MPDASEEDVLARKGGALECEIRSRAQARRAENEARQAHERLCKIQDELKVLRVKLRAREEALLKLRKPPRMSNLSAADLVNMSPEKVRDLTGMPGYDSFEVSPNVEAHTLNSLLFAIV